MTEPYRPVIRTQVDLEEVWRRLMGPCGFHRRSVWLLQVGADRRPVPAVTEITDCEEVPDPAYGASLSAVLSGLDDDLPGGSFAFLISRPGHGVGDDDRAWAAFLHDAGRAAGVLLEVVHLATDSDVVPLPLDDLLLPHSA